MEKSIKVGDLVLCLDPYESDLENPPIRPAVYLGAEEKLTEILPQQWVREVHNVWFPHRKEKVVLLASDIIKVIERKGVDDE